MPRLARLLVPLMSLAALFVLTLLLVPAGASGDENHVASVDRADQYFFGRDADINHPVHGNVQIYAGSATVREPIDGDLLVLGGSVIFLAQGRVTGNILHSGGEVRNADGRVGKRIYPLTSLEGAAASMSQKAVIASLLLVWLIAAVILTLISGREVRFSSLEVRASPLHCFALGLVALTSLVLTAIVFSFLVPYVLGIPLLAALGVFAILTKIYGMVAMFHAIGTLIAGARSRQQLSTRKWLRGDVAMVVLGVLVLGAIRFIPGIGTIVWGLASVFGVGTALATKFGRREPWFLAWRPMEA
jgi:hypothetical protein